MSEIRIRSSFLFVSFYFPSLFFLPKNFPQGFKEQGGTNSEIGSCMYISIILAFIFPITLSFPPLLPLGEYVYDKFTRLRLFLTYASRSLRVV